MSEASFFRGVDFTGTDWGRRNIDIAADLGVEPYLVSAARRHFGMVLTPRHDWSGVDWSKSIAEIAAEMGVSESSVKYQRQQLGLTQSRADYSGVDWSQNNAQIARELGVTPAAVLVQRKKVGVPPAPRGKRAKEGVPAPQKISIFFPAEEFAALAEAAEKRGVTKAALVREAVKKLLE